MGSAAPAAGCSPELIPPLFFYGVLMRGLATGRIAELVGRLEPGVPGTVHGRLYAVAEVRGHYPVLVADPAGGPVRGMVHRAGSGFGPAELAELDRFERFLPDDPAGSDYLRRPVAASLDSGEVLACDAYLYNRPLAGACLALPHGDFARYLAETGAPPLPG